VDPGAGVSIFRRYVSLAPARFEPWIVKSVASRYTDYAFPAIIIIIIIIVTIIIGWQGMAWIP
jgi:hypothetical protein